MWGVFERDKGSAEGFERYTKAIGRLEGRWSVEEMNAFLADPMGFVPGTLMYQFQGIADPSERADVIVYLRANGDAPPPLPE